MKYKDLFYRVKVVKREDYNELLSLLPIQSKLIFRINVEAKVPIHNILRLKKKDIKYEYSSDISEPAKHYLSCGNKKYYITRSLKRDLLKYCRDFKKQREDYMFDIAYATFYNHMRHIFNKLNLPSGKYHKYGIFRRLLR